MPRLRSFKRCKALRAAHFDGWRNDKWRTGLAPPNGPACVAGAKTWLLDKGWRRHGLLAVGERPGRSAG